MPRENTLQSLHTALQDTQENRTQLGKILGSEPLQPFRKVRSLLEFCAMATMEGRTDQLSQVQIARKLWSGKELRHRSDVRTAAARLRRVLDDYYRSDGCEDTIRFYMPEGKYWITAARRRVFPRRFMERSVKDPAAFRDFLEALSNTEGLGSAER